MQRKPGFPVANCSIKMPDNLPVPDAVDEDEPLKKRQQLINFGHSQWGFNNWNWAVTKQDLDFVDVTNGKYTAGVVAFVSITVKSLELHRENIGYATSTALQKGSAIHNARKCAVTNALRETLLSFGGSVTSELIELLEVHKPAEVHAPEPDLPKHSEPKNSPKLNVRKEETRPHTTVPPAIKNAPNPPPVAKAHPMPVNMPPANRPPMVANAPRAPPPPPGPQVRPNSNVSFVLQPVIPPLYGAPRLAGPPVPPPMYPNYYEYPWHFTYEPFDRHHGNVNLNFNIPPKNLVVNSRSGGDCRNACNIRPAGPDDHVQYPPPQNQGCWIKPTIFYDGFWTEQKVKKWVAEQVEKQFPEDTSNKSSSPSAAQPDTTTPKS